MRTFSSSTPKDGKVEPALFDNFATIGLKEGAVLVLDDIRMLVMLPLWRRIALPKIDLTSFGHWSGTGWSSGRDDAVDCSRRTE